MAMYTLCIIAVFLFCQSPVFGCKPPPPRCDLSSSRDPIWKMPPIVMELLEPKGEALVDWLGLLENGECVVSYYVNATSLTHLKDIEELTEKAKWLNIDSFVAYDQELIERLRPHVHLKTDFTKVRI